MTTKTSRRLVATVGLAHDDRITHRIEVTAAKDVDDEAARWLKKADALDA